MKSNWLLVNIRKINVLRKNNQNKVKDHFKIFKLKPHNNVEIKTHQKTNIFVHVKSLKTLSWSTNFKTFPNHFQKQGGDKKYFDVPDKEKFEKQKPRDQFKDETEQDYIASKKI